MAEAENGLFGRLFWECSLRLLGEPENEHKEARDQNM